LHDAPEMSFRFNYIGKLSDELRQGNVTCHGPKTSRWISDLTRNLSVV